MSEFYIARRDSVSEDELMHYGVKGMKWGVRRDVELIANRRRNDTVRKAKNDYEMGKIDKSKYKSLKKQANVDKKSYMNKVKKDFESKSKADQYKMSTQIKTQAIKNVPHRRLKKGLKLINHVNTAYNIASVGLTAAASIMASPAVAPLMGAAAIGATFGQLGSKYIGDKIVDRFS